MAHLPTGLVSHSQKVCSLYKRAARNLRAWNPGIIEFRYKAVLLRARFDENRNVRDARLAKELLQKGEAELRANLHPQPMRFTNSPGGLAYGREPHYPDWMLDYWDPIEKARYPKFFAKREQLKKEYIEAYFKKYPDMKDADKH